MDKISKVKYYFLPNNSFDKQIWKVLIILKKKKKKSGFTYVCMYMYMYIEYI